MRAVEERASPPRVTSSWVHPQVLFNHVRVRQGFSKNGVSVSVTAPSSMHVDIPVIGVHITFHGLAFQIQLSYSNFSHNTEGLCGEWGRGKKPIGAEGISAGHRPAPPSTSCLCALTPAAQIPTGPPASCPRQSCLSASVISVS